MGNLPSAEELIARGETPVRDSITGHTISVTLCERENFLLTWRKHERKLPVDSPWSDHAAIVAYITDNGTVSTARILNSERTQSYVTHLNIKKNRYVNHFSTTKHFGRANHHRLVRVGVVRP